MEAGDDGQLLHGQLFRRFLIRVTVDTLDFGGAACNGQQNVRDNSASIFQTRTLQPDYFRKAIRLKCSAKKRP